MDWLTEPLRYDFVIRALAEVVIMGATCGAIGAYVVVRRLAFIGDAISHAVFPGVVIAYLAGASIMLGALATGLLTALAIGWVARSGRIREDTAIGIFFAAAFALGIVLISTRQTFQGDLTAFLIGNLQGVAVEDIVVSAATGLAVIATLAVLHKELLLASFDRTLAAALGYPIFALDLLLLVLLTITIVVSIQAVGIILVLAMLVTPAATARLLIDRFGPMLALGSLIGAIVGVAGYYLSFHLATASGATIVLLMTLAFLLVFVFAPSHGLLAHRLRHHPEHGASAPAIDPPPGHAHEAGEGDVLASRPRSPTRH
ncbi:MAG: metal ABC transporter permease [Candidatus Limnocylindria bacterium]